MADHVWTFWRKPVRSMGIYVPMFYDVTYHEDGTIDQFFPVNKHAPSVMPQAGSHGCDEHDLSAGTDRSLY